MWDIGGQKSIRPYWQNYYDNTDALIYVVDSADESRMEEAALELKSLLGEEKLAGVPLLVYANKQDLISAKEADEVSAILGLEAYTDRAVQIQQCSAKLPPDENGLQEGMEWMVTQMSESGGGGGGGDNTK